MSNRIRQVLALKEHYICIPGHHIFLHKKTNEKISEAELVRRIATCGESGIGIYASVFTKYLVGERRMTYDHVQAMSLVLGFSDVEKEKLLEEIERDDEAERPISIYDFIDSAKERYWAAYIIRINGNPLEALKQLIILEIDITKILKRLDRYLTIARKQLLRFKAKVLFEKQWVLKEITRKEVILSVIDPIAEQIEDIAEELDDPQIWGAAEHCRADAFYIARKYPIAIKKMNLAVESIIDPIQVFGAYRMLVLCYAYECMKDECVETASFAQRLLETFDVYPEHRILLLDATSRSLGLIKMDTAYDISKQAEGMLTQEQSVGLLLPLRELQIFKSREEVNNILGSSTRSLSDQEHEIAVKLAEKHQVRYPRHAEDILNREKASKVRNN